MAAMFMVVVAFVSFKIVFAATTITVNTLVDENGTGSACSLREAIITANTNLDTGGCVRSGTGEDIIEFDLGSGTPSIAITAALPIITAPVTINGNSGGATRVELNGAGAGSSGLTISAGASTIDALVINRFDSNGIVLTGSGSNLITDSYIGVNAAGTGAVGNGEIGILIDDVPANTIGGALAGERNVIAGNFLDGIQIAGANATENKIQGNYIGTDLLGTTDLGNGDNGIYIADVATNTIGGATAGERNVISGNESNGILVTGNSASGNIIQGNYIGTDSSGSVALGNAIKGVRVDDAPDTLIGGTTTGMGNLISGNLEDGVYLFNSGATGNLVQGNLVGTNAAGTLAVPNTLAGVTISGGVGNTVGGTTAAARNLVSGNADAGICIISNALDNIVQGNYVGVDVTGIADLGNAGPGVFIANSSDNTIGGAATGASNLIAFNHKAGIDLASGSGNTFRANRITNNTDLGITLSDTITVTANDLNDEDVGPNGLQNFPLLTSATNTGSNTTMVGTLNSVANTSYTLDFFANTVCDASGHGEGQTFLGSNGVATNGVGNATINFALNTAVPLAQFVTITATDPDGNTSEFSACVAITGPGGVTATPTVTGTPATPTPTTTGTLATSTPSATATATATSTGTPQSRIYLPLVDR